MIRIAIVEDDLQAARQLQEQVEHFGKENNVETQITLFSDGAKLAGDYRRGMGSAASGYGGHMPVTQWL